MDTQADFLKNEILNVNKILTGYLYKLIFLTLKEN